MTFAHWLTARRQERVAAGLDRRLGGPAPDGVLDLSGNDYLGLRRDARVTAAAAAAAETYGAGAGASRLVNGTLDVHTRLESELAAFCSQPAALVFSTGYHANLAAVTALSDTDTLLVSDAHVHASLVDACRLAHRSRLAVVPHNDVDAVMAALRRRTERRALVVVESVYSVVGDAAPLAELAEAVRAYDAILVVDEAHALGVAGPAGRGLVASAGIDNRLEVVVTGTLSKAFGSQGGVVLAAGQVIEHLLGSARPFVYDTGLAPASAAAATAAVAVIRAEPGLPLRATSTAARVAGLLGLPAPAGSVVSVPLGSPAAALTAQGRLADAGFQVACFRPPSVPDVSRLRFAVPTTVSDQQVDAFVAAVVSQALRTAARS